MAKVTLKRNFDGMPSGAQVGQEIDVDDARVAQLERDGHIERKPVAAAKPLGATDVNPKIMTTQDRPQANPAQRSALTGGGDQPQMKPGERTANEAIRANTAARNR